MLLSNITISTTKDATTESSILPVARSNQPSIIVKIDAPFAHQQKILLVPEIFHKTHCTPLLKKSSKAKAKLPDFNIASFHTNNISKLTLENTQALVIEVNTPLQEIRLEAAFQKTNIEGAEKALVSNHPLFRLRVFEINRDSYFEHAPFIYAQVPRGETNATVSAINNNIKNFFGVPPLDNEPFDVYKARVYNRLAEYSTIDDQYVIYFIQQLQLQALYCYVDPLLFVEQQQLEESAPCKRAREDEYEPDVDEPNAKMVKLGGGNDNDIINGDDDKLTNETVNPLSLDTDLDFFVSNNSSNDDEFFDNLGITNTDEVAPEFSLSYVNSQPTSLLQEYSPCEDILQQYINETE